MSTTGNTVSSLNPGKLTSPSTASGFNQTHSNADSSFKRANNINATGAVSTARQTSQARNNQPLKKQHKVSKKARLADEDAWTESAAMRPFNSRKGQTSITHLMNFTLPPRPQNQHQSFNHRHQRRNPTWGLGSGYHAIDKARYVHANYRFIVRPDRDYHTQAVDADIHLPWDAVLQILGSAETQSTSCPICLSPPVAPRMARCGHIFCLPCLIRYMHSTDDSNHFPEKKARFKRCPICDDSIYLTETRPVRWFVDQEASQLREGGDVLLKLLKREPDTSLALPRDAADNYGHHHDIPWHHVAEVMEYARFMKGGEEYMLSEYDREITDLDLQEKEDELMFGDDNTWTRKAIHAIEESKQRLHGIGNPPSDKTSDKSKLQEDRVPQSWEDEADTPSDADDQVLQITRSVQQFSVARPVSPPLAEPPKHTSAGRRSSHSLYFYHALPNFFLAPLDISILKAAYGDFSLFPTSILPRIEHISTGHVIDDDLRKRAKYMAHLPYGCEVSFLECDWTDIISQSVLDQFSESLSRRRKRNHEKEAREERDRLRAEKEEDDKRLASIRRRRPSIGKSFSETDFQPLAQDPVSSFTDQQLGSTPPWNQRTRSSFATLATPGTSPDAARTVWGTAAIVPNTPPMLAAVAPEKPADDGWLQDWERDLMEGTDAVALVEASIETAGPSVRAPPTLSHAKKTSKKKKITLMSTNTRRGA